MVFLKKRENCPNTVTQQADVTMASDFISLGKENRIERWNKKKEKIKIKRLEITSLYNCYTNGVDRLDFLVTIYRILKMVISYNYLRITFRNYY